jgi:hypothetical protein
MAALLSQPGRIVSLKIVLNFNQRENRRAGWLDIESDELILLRRPSFKLSRYVTTRQNDCAAVSFAYRSVISSANELIFEGSI